MFALQIMWEYLLFGNWIVAVIVYLSATTAAPQLVLKQRRQKSVRLQLIQILLNKHENIRTIEIWVAVSNVFCALALFGRPLSP